jgi:hypothetical protein
VGQFEIGTTTLVLASNPSTVKAQGGEETLGSNDA